MKKIFYSLAISLVLATNAFAADKYIIDPKHANVTFIANHFGFSDVPGTFTNVTGSIFFDETKPEMSAANVTIKTESIQTSVQQLTDHLKGPDFFNVAMNPEVKFVSTAIKVTSKNTGVIEGNLTINGIMKPVKLNVKFNKSGVNPVSKKRSVGFSATGTITRSEFGIKYGLPGVSDEVRLVIEVEAIKEEDILLDAN